MILLTSASCAPCKVVKKFIQDNELEYVSFVDISSPEGMKLVQDGGIRSVPTLVTITGNVAGQQEIINILKEVLEED